MEVKLSSILESEAPWLVVVCCCCWIDKSSSILWAIVLLMVRRSVLWKKEWRKEVRMALKILFAVYSMLYKKFHKRTKDEVRCLLTTIANFYPANVIFGKSQISWLLFLSSHYSMHPIWIYNDIFYFCNQRNHFFRFVYIYSAAAAAVATADT